MEKKTINKESFRGSLRNALCKERLELNEYGEVLLAKKFLSHARKILFGHSLQVQYPHIFKFGIPVSSECP